MTPRLASHAATPREHLLALPGDELIRHAAGSLTHAITVHCSRQELWPWLIQMGADRAGLVQLRHAGQRRAAQRRADPAGAATARLSARCFRRCPGRSDGFVLARKRADALARAGLAGARRRAGRHVGVRARRDRREHDAIDRARARQRRLPIPRAAESRWGCCWREWCTSSWSASSCSRSPAGPSGAPKARSAS